MRTLRILLAICLILLTLTGCSSPGNADLMAGIHAAERPAKPAAPGSAFVQSVDTFSWALFRESMQSAKNPMVSPASVYFALAMTLNGANGPTQQAMLKALSASQLSVEALNTGCRDWMSGLMADSGQKPLKVSNSIWYNDGFAADPDFLQVNADYHAAALRQLDFADSDAAVKINDWVNKATDGLIKQIMDKADESDLMYLINAVYFKSEWQEQFPSIMTTSGDFTSPQGTVRVRFMQREGLVTFLTDQDLQGVLLPFKDPRFAFIAILPPTNRQIRDVANILDAAALQRLMQSRRQTNLVLQIPKFEIQYETMLEGILTKLGMGLALQPEADFSRMVKNRSRGLYISGVKHKTFFKMDEKGAEAAGVTGVTMAATAAVNEKRKLVFDRPFLYGILDTSTGLPLFLGILDDPGQP